MGSKKFFEDKIFAAIDVGTTKISVLVAKIFGEKEVSILGYGIVPSDGLKKGVVVDVARTVASIRGAVREAELMSGCDVDEAVVGISGGHINSMSSSGTVPIKKNEVKQSDIDNVINYAKAVKVPEGEEVLHVLPKYFSIDGGEAISNPLGMYGVRLEADVHIVTGSLASVKNLVKCCEMAGVTVRDVILEQLASAEAVLSRDEKELGVGVLDIGGGTADFAVFYNGGIRHTNVFPVAGNHFTRDVAIALGVSLGEAERIKCASQLFFDSQSMVEAEVPRRLDSEFVSAVLKARAVELIRMVRNEIDIHSLGSYASMGIVLTGGGSMLQGIDILSRGILGVKVRIGRPSVISDVSENLETPIYATGYGLVVYAARKFLEEEAGKTQGSMLGKVAARMRSWVADFF